jgi:hypothetical protein
MNGYEIKQSQTASPLYFLMIDSVDHIAAKTGLSPTVTLSKNGGSFASPSGAVTEIGSGWYKVAGNATDSGTLGPLVLHATSAGADPCDMTFMVVAYDPQDSVRMGQTALPNAAAGATGGVPLSADSSGRTDVLKINGTSQTARDIGASVLLSAGTGTGQLDFTSGVVKSNLAQILGTALTETAGLLAGGFKKFFNIATPQATMDHGILVDTVTTTTTATNLTNAASAGDFTATMKTSIGTAVAGSAVASVTGNVGGNVTGSVGSVAGAVGSVTGNVGGNVTGSVGSVAGAVGSVTGNVGGNVVGSVGSVSGAVASVTAGVTLADGAITAAKIAADAITAAKVASDVGAEIADAVCDEALSGHSTAGTVGKAMSDIDTATGTTIPAAVAAKPTAAEINTTLTVAHGSGAWTGSGGGGGGGSQLIVSQGEITISGTSINLATDGPGGGPFTFLMFDPSTGEPLTYDDLALTLFGGTGTPTWTEREEGVGELAGVISGLSPGDRIRIEGVSAGSNLRGDVLLGFVVLSGQTIVIGRSDEEEATSPNRTLKVGEENKSVSFLVYMADGTTPQPLTAWGPKQVVIERRGKRPDKTIIDDADITISGDDDEVFSFVPGSPIVDEPDDFVWSLREVSSQDEIISGSLTVSYSPVVDPSP